MNKRIILPIVTVVVVVLVGMFFVTKKPAMAPAEPSASSTQVVTTDPSASTQPSTSIVVSASPKSTPAGFTMAQVATHNSRTSCWTVVNGGVYDLTAWIATHPGGEENIIKTCGIDGSSLFNAQHSGNAKPEGALAKFKIGALVK